MGIYHWGGGGSHSVSAGVETIAQLGGTVARIALSPRYLRDYGISPECAPGFSLASAAATADLDRALSHPNIEVMVITAYDGASFGDCQSHRYLDPAFYTQRNRAALNAEYSEFTLYLYRRFRSSHKRFLLANWEGDNAVYCGAAYRYAQDASFRQLCLANYQSSVGVASPDVALQGMKLWLQARYEGIAEGRRRAEAEGMGGMRVYAAPEINAVRCLRERGYGSVLYDVLPYVRFDYVSYSAYESINAADPGATLRQDLNLIRDTVGSTAIFLGESGFSRKHWGPQAVTRVQDVLKAALDWGVEYVIHWQLFDQTEDVSFGLYDMYGAATPFEPYFRSVLQRDTMTGE